ncbi:MAG: hypothetical protein KAQ62_16875 [Cyclobacteriaceae bacterium]|nr:hypothetical protein [Cyclobacteriaceae bacterium]
MRKILSYLPNLVFASSDPKENEEVWTWHKLIGFYAFLIFIFLMLALGLS